MGKIANLIKKRRILLVALVVVLIAVVCGGLTLVAASTYTLNHTFNATVTVVTPTPTPTPVAVSLYRDPEFTDPFTDSDSLSFGVVVQGEAATPQSLYYKTTEISSLKVSITPSGYDIEADTSTSGVIVFTFTAGSGLTPGNYTFSVTVTGSGP